MVKIQVSEPIALENCSRELLIAGVHDVPQDVADAAIAAGATMADAPPKKAKRSKATPKKAEVRETAAEGLDAPFCN